MNRRFIDLEQWKIKPLDLWDNQWLLLCAGDYASSSYNCMTVSWGSFGIMWNKPFALVVVRPQRYTYQFMEKYPDFSLCAFSPKLQPVLNLLGKKSGRDSNKIEESGLTPIQANQIQSPVYSEATLAVECKKIYWDDLKPDHFMASYIQTHYPLKDYSRIYYGEIVQVSAIDEFISE